MKSFILFLTLLFSGLSGCAKKQAAVMVDGDLLKLRQAVADGKYEEGLTLAKEISSKVPPGASTQEAFYLQGYILAYGKADFQGARLSLKNLLDSYPNGSHSPQAQKLLADCQYWQGNYGNAQKEYSKLASAPGGKGIAGYARFQAANCLLLDDKVGEAQEAYREIVEKLPSDPLTDSAQLMLANTYLKLQNAKAAKSELKKLLSFTRNKELQRAAQKALRQIEEEGPSKRGASAAE